MCDSPCCVGAGTLFITRVALTGISESDRIFFRVCLYFFDYFLNFFVTPASLFLILVTVIMKSKRNDTSGKRNVNKKSPNTCKNTPENATERLDHGFKLPLKASKMFIYDLAILYFLWYSVCDFGEDKAITHTHAFCTGNGIVKL